jgi:hypothetical protein
VTLVFWLASAAGAALFFLAGILAGRDRGVAVSVARQVPPPPLPVPADPELAHLRNELTAVRTAQAEEQAKVAKAYHDVDAAKAQVERLRIDLMRAQKQTSDVQAEHQGAAAQLTRLREELSTARAATRSPPRTPLRVKAAGHKAGDVLQALVDGLSGQAEIRCAVVADDLGLVVASRGELGDEVAAVGALFGRAGLQAQKVLPLHKVQRVTVEDDQNVTLTLRPLQTDEGVEGDLALITLAVGNAEPRGKLGEQASRSVRPT